MIRPDALRSLHLEVEETATVVADDCQADNLAHSLASSEA